jgi:hypothetical protein
MSYKDKTYIIFDGDKDQWAYRYMRGWKANERIDFDFEDAHDLLPLTYRAQDETYIKFRLSQRFKNACQVILLIGESTKYLYKYIRWELEVVIALNLPLIAVNLDNRRSINDNLCPPLIRHKYAIHIPFKMAIIKYALDNFPDEFRHRYQFMSGPEKYSENIYRSLGL